MAGSSRPTAPTHHACTPTASPSGVLRHRDDPFAVPPRSLRPCPHRCCQSHDSSAGCSLWLCTRPTARTALQVCVCGDAPRTGRAPLERTNCTHACDSAACSLSCLRMYAVDQFMPSAGWDGVGGRWPVCAIPKRVVRSGQGPERRGFPPSQPRLLAPVGRVPAAEPPTSTDSVRGLPPLAQGDGRVHTVPS